MSAALDLAEALRRSVGGSSLTREEARGVFSSALSSPAADPAQLGGLLASMATRGESAEEIAGAAEALRAAMRPFEHPFADAIDTCGTGGDGLATFNLSTAAAIVACAAGARVVKHGNRALSSRCGSADLLEAAGIPLELPGEASRAVLEEVGITFLFAPAYHPALKQAAGVRKALGVRTIFNLLGPLVNPGRVRRQLLGVGEARRVPQLAEALRALGHERAYVVHGAGGADELTLQGANLVHPVGSAPAFEERGLGLARAPVSALGGGDAARNLALLWEVLDGAAGPLQDAVLLNSAAALVVAGVAGGAGDGLERARAAVRSGAARAKLARWIECARRRGRP